MKKKLTNNLGLKILAVLFSACLWLICININDPISQDSYNVTVQLQNMNTLTSAGKYVEVVDNSDQVRVTVRGSRTVLSSFSDKNIVATADLTKMTEDNLVPIEVTTTKISDGIESIKADKQYVLVSVDNVNKQQLPISVKVQNEPAEGYIMGNTTTAENVVIVSGPESVVDMIEYAAVEINVEGATSDVKIALPIHLYDENDEILDISKLSMSMSEVTATAAILETKQLPVNCMVTGGLLDGYALTGKIDCTPSVVTIAGRPNIIKNIQAVDLKDAVDVSGKDKNVTAQIDVMNYLPDGVTVVGGSTASLVDVVVHIEKEEEKNITLSADRLHVTNLPEGMTAKIEEKEDLELKAVGLKDELGKINSDELIGVIDVAKYMKDNDITELSAGAYTMPIDITLTDNTRLSKEYRVKVVLKGE